MPAPPVDATFGTAIGDGAATTFTYSHTISSNGNRVLTVAVTLEGTLSVVSGITYNAVAMTLKRQGDIVEGPNRLYTSIWYMLEASLPVGGTYTVEVTLSSNETNKNWAATSISVYDAQQAAPEADALGSSDVDATAITTAITTLTADALIIEAVACNIGTSWVPGSGQTERSDQQSTGSVHTHATGTDVTTTAGAYSQLQTAAATWGRAIHLLLAIAPVAVGITAGEIVTASGSGNISRLKQRHPVMIGY